MHPVKEALFDQSIGHLLTTSCKEYLFVIGPDLQVLTMGIDNLLAVEDRGMTAMKLRGSGVQARPVLRESLVNILAKMGGLMPLHDSLGRRSSCWTLNSGRTDNALLSIGPRFRREST